MGKKKVVLTYGTFDLFHIGHLKLLQRLKELGDELIVGVSSDEFNTKKGKKTIIPYEQRVEIIQNIQCVDKTIKEDSWEQKLSDIKEHDVTIFAMGSDWTGKFDFLQEACEVVYMQRTKNISSGSIKKILFTLQ